MNVSTSVDDTKTSAEIVDELFKELQTKSLDLKPIEEVLALDSTTLNVNSTSKKSHKHKKRSRSRGESSGESSSDDSKRHRHHKRRKKKKSESENRKRHKHKHSRSKKNREKDEKNRQKHEDDDVEWESDTGNDKKIDFIEKIDVNNDEKSDLKVCDEIVNPEISENVSDSTLPVEESANCEDKELKEDLVTENNKEVVKEKASDGGSTGGDDDDSQLSTKKDKTSSKRHRKKRKSSHKDSKECSRETDRRRSVSRSSDHRRRRRSSSRSRHSRSNRDDWRSSSRRQTTRSDSNSTERNRRRSRSPRRDSNNDSEKIDKAKLLEIARKNAMVMFSQGRVVMPGVKTDNVKQQQMVALRSGGKSVAELTNFCKQLVNKDDATSSEGESTNVASDEESGPFIQHPFKLKDPQPNIVMNIKNAVQVPVKTPAEKAAESAKLRIQFPVSSGSQHRKKESEWVPVTPPKESVPKFVACSSVVATNNVAVVEEKVFPESNPQTTRSIDIGNIVSQRLKAVKKLQENPHDVEALSVIYQVQQQAQSWAESKQLPGQFTGSTNARLLTPEELAGPAHLQAWVKKDQFNRAPPVDGGMGMYLLRKMGWNPGEGLGKHKEGVTVPLMLDIKMDKKGLTSAEETARKIPSVPALKDLSGKHPVSALVELCSKRKWSPPDFNLVHDSGPDHKKNFLFQVRINNVDYQPTIASSNKKHAKAQAATVCLQALGLYPRDLNNPL